MKTKIYQRTKFSLKKLYEYDKYEFDIQREGFISTTKQKCWI